MDPGLRIAASLEYMDPKDRFMRYVVVGSIVTVGLLALIVSMNS
jgi:hypothetical protein